MSHNASGSTDSNSDGRGNPKFLRIELIRLLGVSIITFGMLFALYFLGE